MADVAQVCKIGEPVVSGRVVVRKGQLGAVNVIEPKINQQAPVARLDAKYTDRFDDERYYSGDTSS